MLVDATGRAIGTSVGFYSGVYPQLLTADGVILTFDNDPSTNAAIPLLAGLYYQDASCSGTPYANSSGLPIQTAVLAQTPATPGSQIYRQFGSLVRFRAASTRLNGACTASTTSVIGFEVRTAGTVPNVVKPLSVVATG